MKTHLRALIPALIIALLVISCNRDTSTTPGTSAVFFGWWDGEAPANYEPLVIAAAPLGMEYLPNDYTTVPFPMNRNEYLLEIMDCYDAGASVVHIVPVAAEPDTVNSLFEWTWDNYIYIINYVRKNCPGMLICADLTQAAAQITDSLKADSAVTFVAPVYGRYLYDDVWTGFDIPSLDGVNIVGWQAAGVKVMPLIVSPQQADYFNLYLNQVYLQSPMHFTIAIGWESNSASTEEVFNTIVATLPDTSKFMVVCTRDNPNELMGLAIAKGYHLRVGMKNAVYWPGNTYSPVPSSSFMVQKAVELASQINRDIATPEEAAIILDAYR
ncbi:MAG: 3-keto-5-aminohexanoate cleavage protein [FCB group bacterium]|nr:3-keto-5-aminohexanoate cleavage protein [FCB group bacterium]